VGTVSSKGGPVHRHALARRPYRRYPQVTYIIPGHLGWTDNRSLQHTLNLLQAHKP
jgi:hypothetical protein